MRLQKAAQQEGDGKYGTFNEETELKAAKPLPPPTPTPTLPDNLVIKVNCFRRKILTITRDKGGTRKLWEALASRPLP